MDPLVELEQGQIRGTTTAGVTAFLGIPYASAPAGPAMFQAPGPAPRWDGVRDATAFGPTAPQPPYNKPLDDILENPRLDGEEFLNVNVWTPDPGSAGLPVMVWIHGGAFRNGSNAVSTYDGANFARDGVVLVSINYRLGAPGFAVLDDAPHNRGLLDQLAALRWVQDNVASFGGDPGRVTIFGESAGAMSVATLLGSPAAKGLFQRAIMQSGNGSIVADLADGRLVARDLAARLGIDATSTDFGALSSAAVIDAQNALYLDLAANPDPARYGATTIKNGLGLMPLIPVVDGDIVPHYPIDAIAAGFASDIPLLLGTTTEEMRLFLAPTGITAGLPAEMLPLMVPRFGGDPTFIDTYTGNRPGATPGDVLAAIGTDSAFRVPTARFADGHHASGGETYVYEFAWRTEHLNMGACHAMELPFVFDTLASGGAQRMTASAPAQDVADAMHSAWVSFAHGKDPGWARYDADSRPVMTFDQPESRVVNAPRDDERALWG
ncbi:carboxylesterase family protein [Antrihabitans stalactiti]|uniref:Carboxylic ester hydrolase n=1 Tax=Antrihabitans stalactiti TaxID=2584121 RepID=A0A848KBL4_9NOCA|nr:carboxylesterase/lipase family protein [Antrihabitans stalactiti]